MTGGTYIAEKIRVAIESLCLPQSPDIESEYLTISLGVASCMPDTPCNSKELLKDADEALYQAKESGRNQVKVAQ